MTGSRGRGAAEPTGAVRGLVALVCVLTATVLVPAGAEAAEGQLPAEVGSGDPAELLTATAAALGQPHVGRVSIVTFSAAGPRVADLEVQVDAMGGMELRRPTRWLVGSPAGGSLRTEHGAVTATPVATGARLDVPTVLAAWEATVGAPRVLDTGPATPVHLVRRSGAAVEEVVYVDHATALPVRRETRDAEGGVLRVVAYTHLAMVDLGGPAAVAPPPLGEPDRVEVGALVAAGYAVPASLNAGFRLRDVHHGDGMVTARYGDGLSVLSLYQQQGRLDPSALDGAVVRLVADRHVWTWPGSEPLRLVWTDGDRTWTAVSDAPLAVVEDALGSLPGDRVGHDVPSRIARGISRVWSWLRDTVT